MIGYWNRPEETADILRDHVDETGTRRWLHTGDLGYLDDDGYVFIVDRKKDLIKTSGYQVWPREVEEVLAAHPAVAEVGVAGVPDDVKRRSRQGLGRVAGGADRNRPGAADVLPRKAGSLQSAITHRVPDRAAENAGGKSAAPGAEGRIRLEKNVRPQQPGNVLRGRGIY